MKLTVILSITNHADGELLGLEGAAAKPAGSGGHVSNRVFPGEVDAGRYFPEPTKLFENTC